MAKLEGKVAIVTGGSRGIGLATARALVADGARVVISSTTADGAATVARELGPAVVGVRADVRIEADVEAVFAAAVTAFGGLDILINNAGVGIFERVDRLSLAQFEQVIDTNLTGVFRCTRLALPLLKARGLMKQTHYVVGCIGITQAGKSTTINNYRNSFLFNFNTIPKLII